MLCLGQQDPASVLGSAIDFVADGARPVVVRVAVFVAVAAAVAPVEHSPVAVHVPLLAAAADFVGVAVGAVSHELSLTDAFAYLSSESARASFEWAYSPPAQAVAIVVLIFFDAVGGRMLAAAAAAAPAKPATVGDGCWGAVEHRLGTLDQGGFAPHVSHRAYLRHDCRCHH